MVRQQLIDEETREPVAPEHKGRGSEVAKGQYLIVENAELGDNSGGATPQRHRPSTRPSRR
jgi:non-homologous end joining protein Ku